MAGADGQFSVTLQPPQTDGQPLQVTVTDPAGNVSSGTTITAPNDGVGNPPDTTPPDAPTALVINAQGNTLTGRAEPGSTVRVLGADGTVLGSTVAGADGVFSVTLQPPQTDGQALQVTATDAAGNVSSATAITAPDDGIGNPPDTTPLMPRPSWSLAWPANSSAAAAKRAPACRCATPAAT